MKKQEFKYKYVLCIFNIKYNQTKRDTEFGIHLIHQKSGICERNYQPFFKLKFRLVV